jgi:hypothetical protein
MEINGNNQIAGFYTTNKAEAKEFAKTANAAEEGEFAAFSTEDTGVEVLRVETAKEDMYLVVDEAGKEKLEKKDGPPPEFVEMYGINPGDIDPPKKPGGNKPPVEIVAMYGIFVEDSGEVVGDASPKQIAIFQDENCN